MEDMFINRADVEDPDRVQRSEVDPDQVKDNSQVHNVISNSGQEGIDTEVSNKLELLFVVLDHLALYIQNLTFF